MNYLSILHMVLPFVILVGAKPTDADLHKLRGRDLRDRNLEGADLRGANLIHAHLTDTNLRWTDLRGANLFGTDGFEFHPLGAD